MQPINYDKEILSNLELGRLVKKGIEVDNFKESHFQHFTDGFVGAMALIGIITIGYQVIKLLVSLFK